jgi:hypothetical protein
MRTRAVICAGAALLASAAARLALGGAGPAPGGIRFEDRSPASGLAFVLRNAASPQKHQIETMAGGVAVLDYDNDGRPDLYFANGARQPDLLKSGPEYHNRLYRNTPGGVFEDVTEKAGVRGEGYSMGVASADYDNDGWCDLLVAGVNRNILFRNRGDGSFQDATARAGLEQPPGQPQWAIGAAWLDYDRDGFLDLFLARYVKWDPAREPYCGNPGVRTYCHPKFYQALPNQLFRNNGDGTFRDVSGPSGIARHAGKGMGVAVADYDQDGAPDIFVANDTVPNFLFRNQGDGTFREAALEAGVAYNDDGRALSSMGVDFRDVDNDGREDLFVTALASETYPLYRNLGKGLFADVTFPSKLGAATLPLSGWSNGIFDFDNDGWKDLFAANGDVQDNTELFSSRKSRLANSVFRNRGDGSFEMSLAGSPALHRGAAFGDFDGDGRVDVIVTRIADRPLLLRNVSPGANHWLGVRLRGRRSNRYGLGAKLTLVTASGRRQWNHATTSVGYASASDRAVHFGLGRDRRVQWLEIRWPSGAVQKLADVAADRYLEVSEP